MEPVIVEKEQVLPHELVMSNTNGNKLWNSIFVFLELKDIFKVQSLSINFWCLVNPSSPKCLIDYYSQFGLITKRPIESYGSIR
jgi:hypothetical protein